MRLILWNAFVVLLILSVVFLGIYFYMQNRLDSLVQSKAALLLALLGGYFLAERALSPVKTITRKAQDITADAGKEKLTPSPVDMRMLVNEVVEELRILAEEKNQTLSTSIEKKVEAKVDLETIRLAVSNILHNAILYTQEEGKVEVHTAKTEDGEAIIDIIDNGPGIPEAERSKVFERFYRVDKARSRAEGGAGLGLAIARWAVEVSGGAIAFRDNNEPGTHCRIILPEVRAAKQGISS